ncbi:lipocalin family protein [Chryseolinea sp. T2]|uniref:lipocalin family protein n=1 Tax=Chryseolinea sp. T2 TaxID=3129255 RepID=UPI00307827AB
MKHKKLFWTAMAAAAMVPVLYYTRSTAPSGAKPVTSFDKQKYLGKWYEIARLDYYFEQNLDNVTATYSLNEDGTIRVDNKGFDVLKNKWKESIGKAKFADDPSVGKLKVSFFGPFYAGYNVIAIDEHYQYALVAGRNLDYLWLLSRETTMPERVSKSFLQKASALGYQVKNLIWVKHDQ